MKEKEYKYMVGVVCMTFNQSKYILDALNGFVMQQTNFPFVVMVVDDASTDGEQKIIKEFISKQFDLNDTKVAYEEETDYAHITFARHKINLNCHIVALYLKENHHSLRKKKLPHLTQWRNYAKYEALCEGDDYWIDPFKLQKQVDFLENNPEYTMCHTSFKYYYESQQKYLTSKDILINHPIINNGLTCEKILTNYRIQTVTVIYKHFYKDILSKEDPFLYGSGYFLMGDTPLWYGLLTKGKIGFIPDITSVYRKNNTSMTRTPNYKAHFRFELSSSELRKYLAERDSLSVAFKKQIEEQYVNRLINYLAFDSNFSSYFKINNLKEVNGIKYQLFKWGILKPLLITKIKAMRFVGNIRRHFINSL